MHLNHSLPMQVVVQPVSLVRGKEHLNHSLPRTRPTNPLILSMTINPTGVRVPPYCRSIRTTSLPITYACTV